MKLIYPSKISGKIESPPSKSIIQRMLISDFFCENLKKPDIEFIPDDILVTYQVLESIKSGIFENISLLESGFCYRVLPLLASIYNNKNYFIIKKSLADRPNINNLNELGFETELQEISDNDYKFTVNGKLNSGVYNIDGSITSQSLTALLMILPILDNDSTIHVTNLKSRDYINLTLDILKSYSIEVIHKDYKVFHIKGNQKYSKVKIYEEGDWSGASFLISAGLIAGNGITEITGLNPNSVQADSKIINILKLSNSNYSFTENILKVKSSKLKSFEYDFGDCPDLVPAVLPIAINCDNICNFKNINNLRYKESNRIETLIEEYNKCGILIENYDDSLVIHPGKFIGSDVNPRNDHRIAMSLAISALNGYGSTTIENPFCVNKSFPTFWNYIKKLGANVNE
jgi:3-phosphoshikimate 1-carboxyvinyltransferase